MCMKSPRSENLRYIPLQRAAAPRYRRRTLDDRTDDISVQLRDICAYDIIFNFNRLLPNLNLNPFDSTQQEGQVTVVNRTSSFRFRCIREDIGMSSSKFVYRLIYFGQMSRCIHRFLEELFISFGVQFFDLNLDKI